jgi:deazaflavin-dependent oxidoreductase (nitroreductase family)
MATGKDALKERLSKASEIIITVTGRRSRRSISLPIWFVWEDGKAYLLPVKGSETQWYQNIIKNPSMQIEAGGAKAEFQAFPLTEATQVKSVIEKFRAKYGPGDVKKYYSKFDVAVIAGMR